MPDALFAKLNQIRKKKYFDSLINPQKKYACIGVGMHSLTNLYPLIRHFGIDLKYICTQKSSWDKKMNIFFPGCHFTNSITAITNDREVEAVFVCASASSHYDILTQLFKSNKKIFVEKPPCANLAELENLVNLSKGTICKVGLQRKYWPGNHVISKRIRSAKTYTYQFHFGPYIQGDPFTELFIHALHYCVFLFGECKLNSFSNKKDHKGITVQLHVTHHNGISGLLELSTHFSWNSPTDNITINCDQELLHIQYPALVKGEQKPKRVFNLPTERLLNEPVVTKEYYSIHNLIMPVMELNTLVVQGFYDEIRAFIKLAESDVSGRAENDLPELLAVYKIIEELKRSD